MKTLYIVKVGTTFPATRQACGDFDRWTRDLLGPTDLKVAVVDAEHGAGLPDPGDCAGVVVTGSHDMVTDERPWSMRVGQWIPSLLENGIPFLGICYGHQLLAHACGGQVGFHPQGKEIGTVEIEVLAEGRDDGLLQGLPPVFPGHVTHAQTVLKLPPAAVRLAGNTHEPNHAFRLGECAWGIQFHPEFDEAIMRSYVIEQSESLRVAGRDIDAVLSTVKATPVATQVGRNFVRVVEKRISMGKRLPENIR